MESSVGESQAPRLSHDLSETSNAMNHPQEAAPHSPSIFVPSPRDDSTFTFLFLAAILTTFAFGVGIMASTSTEGLLHMGHAKLRLSHYNPTTNTCELQLSPQQTTTPPAASGCDSDQPAGGYSDSATFVARLALDFLFASTLAVPVSHLLFYLLRRYARPLLVLLAPVLSVLLLALGLAGGFLGELVLFSWGLDATSEARGFEAVGMLMARSAKLLKYASYLYNLALLDYLFVLIRDRVERSADKGLEMLTKARKSWQEHFLLLLVNPALFMAAMAMVIGPILTMVWHAFNVGEVVPDFDVVEADRRRGGGSCALATCCREERPLWVYAYLTFASITAFWVLMVSMILQHAVVSGTVSLSYFTYTRTNSSAKDNIKRSLRNAYGPSFGTACNLGTIFTTFEVALVKASKKISSYILSKTDGQVGIAWSTLSNCFRWISRFPDCQYPQMPSIFLGRTLVSPETSPILIHLPKNDQSQQDKANLAYLEMSFICTFAQTVLVHGWTRSVLLVKFMMEKSFGHWPSIIVFGMVSGIFLYVSSVVKMMSVYYALERDRVEISKPEAYQTFWIAESFIA